MGIGDLFKAKENEELRMALEESKRLLKACKADLEKSDQEAYDYRKRVKELESQFTPEMADSIKLQRKIKEQEDYLAGLNGKIESQLLEFENLKEKIKKASEELVVTDETVLMQSFGIYEPHYSFANSTGYKEELSKIRQAQKDMVKSEKATVCNTQWTVSGSREKGIKMTKDTSKLLLRAFNTECDDTISSVKFNNVESAEKRIRTAHNTISRLGKGCGDITIQEGYLNLKIKELQLAYEYQIEKQKEKDRLKELRAEERERAKLEKEIEAERKKLEKEAKHYNNALRQIIQQIANADPAEMPDLEQKKAELESKIADTDKAREQVDYRAANQKAGYVYIISNIGAFGEGVYKIGMTRRLEPMDRVDELGDASVPFDFDVHAMIFSDNAPALETALHHAFEDRKLNMVNTRREFFRVSLDEIKEVVKRNYDKTVEFYDVPMAEQFRKSELMRSQK